MEPKKLNAEEAKTRILQMLGHDTFVSLATVSTDGYPDVRVLLIAAHDGVETIWFATEPKSAKVAQIQKNPKAVLYGYDMQTMTEFRLFGNVELLTDTASRRKVWRDDFVQHFPEGVDSPNMIVLRFSTNRGIYDSYGREVGKF